MWIDAASKLAGKHDDLMLLVNVITIVAFVLVNAVLIYFVIRYRRRGPNDITSNVAHNTTIEVVWTVIPTIIMMILFVMGMNIFGEMRAQGNGTISFFGLIAEETPPPKIENNIYVKASKWKWTFYYPSATHKVAGKEDKRLRSDILYLEENKHTKMVMKSNDVIHSFFVPAFRVKEDVVGSIYTFVYVQPLITKIQESLSDKARLAKFKDDPCVALKKSGVKRCGAYRVYCTEYCGTDHSNMLNWAVVLPTADFEKQMTVLSLVKAKTGEEIFNTNCKTCHTTDGSRGQGPSFKGLWEKERVFEDGSQIKADENYIRESIRNPGKKVVKGYGNLMPSQGTYTDEEIDNIIEFIKKQK